MQQTPNPLNPNKNLK